MTKDPIRRKAQRKVAQARYERTAKGKATLKRCRDKRIFLHRDRCIGVAATVEEARAINAHIKRRKLEFIARRPE